MNNNNNVTIIREIKFKFTDEEYESKYLNDWLRKFKYKEVKIIYNLLKLKEPNLLHYGLSFMMPLGVDRNVTPLDRDISLELLKKIIEKILVHIGFNELIKDYIIVLYIGKKKSKVYPCDREQPDFNPDTFNKDNLYYECEVLFDVPLLKEEEIKMSLKNYFNYYLFKYKMAKGWFNPFFDETSYFLKTANNPEDREKRLKNYKAIIAPFEKELADSSNKLVDSGTLCTYIRYLLDEIFFGFRNANSYNLQLSDELFNKFQAQGLEKYRKLYMEGIRSGGGILENYSEFSMIKYKKKDDEVQAEWWLENFIADDWYEFPVSGMFKHNMELYEEQFRMEGYGVYKQFLEDAKKDCPEN